MKNKIYSKLFKIIEGKDWFKDIMYQTFMMNIL